MNGEGNGDPLQYSCLENPMDGGVWWATVHRVAKSQTWLSDFTSLHLREHLMQSFPGSSEVKGLPAMWENRVRSLGWEDPLEKEMTTHSGTLA